jgi:hypothetical protein
VIVHYRHRPKAKRPIAQPARITGSGIVTARRPQKYQRKLDEVTGEPDASVREFYVRMGLGAVYDRIDWTLEQK